MSHPEMFSYIFALIAMICLFYLSSSIGWISYLFMIFAFFTVKNIFMFIDGWRVLFYKDMKIGENIDE